MADEDLLVGAAQASITPPVGTPMTGYILRDGPSEGVHDPLYARALVFDDGITRAAVLACDVLALGGDFVSSTRDRIATATGIQPSNIMIASTHTHSGPATIFLRRCGDVASEWLETLGDRLVSLCQTATMAARPARTGAGSAVLAAGVENRRTPDGPVDGEVAVLYAEGIAGEPIAVVVNFACHPTVLDHRNRLFSADYPGVVADRVSASLGAMAMCLTGASGDQGPVPAARRAYNPLDASAFSPTNTGAVVQQDFERVGRLGTAVAEAAIRAVRSVDLAGAGRVVARSAVVQLPLLAAPAEQELLRTRDRHRRGVDSARGRGSPAEERVHRAMMEWADETLCAVRRGEVQTSVPAEVQVVRIGGAALVGVPGEPFAGIGQAIKDQAKGNVLVVGYANDDIGYIPTREEYARGGYEIGEAHKYYGYPSALDPSAGETLVRATRGLLESASR